MEYNDFKSINHEIDHRRILVSSFIVGKFGEERDELIVINEHNTW